jgi:hypothetical protein
VLTLTNDRLDVTRFQGKMGSGTVTASGGVVYRLSLAFDLAMAANGVRMLYPDGMRETAGAHLTLIGMPQAAHLGGQIRIEDFSFAPDFDLNNFINQFTGETTAPAPAQSFSQNLQLEIGVQSTSNINLASKELSFGGTANLRITGTAAQPVILGRVNLIWFLLQHLGRRHARRSPNRSLRRMASIRSRKSEAIRHTFNLDFPGLNLSRSWIWEPKSGQVTYEGEDRSGKPVKVTYLRSQLSSHGNFSSPPTIGSINDTASY